MQRTQLYGSRSQISQETLLSSLRQLSVSAFPAGSRRRYWLGSVCGTYRRVTWPISASSDGPQSRSVISEAFLQWVSEWVNQFIHSALKTKSHCSALQPRQTKMSFKSRWNCPSSTSGCRSVAGRLFHTFRHATERLLSPCRVFVRGSMRALASAERRQSRPESAIGWQSSARYDGVFTA